jgi:hypothetical protein
MQKEAEFQERQGAVTFCSGGQALQGHQGVLRQARETAGSVVVMMNGSMKVHDHHRCHNEQANLETPDMNEKIAETLLFYAECRGDWQLSSNRVVKY